MKASREAAMENLHNPLVRMTLASWALGDWMGMDATGSGGDGRAAASVSELPLSPEHMQTHAHRQPQETLKHREQ